MVKRGLINLAFSKGHQHPGAETKEIVQAQGVTVHDGVRVREAHGGHSVHAGCAVRVGFGHQVAFFVDSLMCWSSRGFITLKLIFLGGYGYESQTGYPWLAPVSGIRVVSIGVVTPALASFL
ncbi:hypothetical protein LINPERHAP2_LOCUS3359 [Linum perenne]